MTIDDSQLIITASSPSPSPSDTPSTPTPSHPPSSSSSSSSLSESESESGWPLFRRWAAELQWNPDCLYSGAYHAADPAGFFVGWLPKTAIQAMGAQLLPDEQTLPDDALVPVATISAVRYANDTGFIGLYIVRNPALRGKGLGIRMFRHAMAHLGDSNCNMALDGVVEQQHNYMKSGFSKVCDIFRRSRHPAPAPPLPVLPAGLSRVDDLTTLDPSRLANYESKHSGLARSSQFMKSIIDQTCRKNNKNGIDFTFTVALEKKGTDESDHGRGDSDIAGFGCIRRAEVGYRVGPLHACSLEAATYILVSLLRCIPCESEPVFIDNYGLNDENARRIVQAAGFDETVLFTCGRMWTKSNPVTDPKLISETFAVMTLELG